MEKFISEMFGFLLTVVMMGALFLTGVLWYNVNQFNSFKNQTEQVIERTGGVSDDAVKQLNDLSNTYYHNHFAVVNTYNDTSVGYGQQIKYDIDTNIPLSFHRNHTLGDFFTGSGSPLHEQLPVLVTSQVRQGSQQDVSNTTDGGHFKANKVPYGTTHDDYSNHNNNNGHGFTNGKDKSGQAIETPQND